MEFLSWKSPDIQHSQFHCIESPTMPSEPAWTTARCNRLLRPLSSKISLLRKSRMLDGTRQNSGEEESESSQNSCLTASGAQSNATNGKEGVPTPTSSLRKHGLNWESPQPRKKIKLTYSSREPIHSSKVVTASAHAIPSELERGPANRMAASFVSVDEPLLPSIVMGKYCSQTKDKKGQVWRPSQSGTHSVNARSREIFRKYAKSAYPDCWKLYDGIHSGLETLLKATSKSLTGNRIGARSLLSTCLRKTPEYIAAQESWCREQDPESAGDVSPGIYGELEQIGACSVYGSNALQEVVRAHGVDMVGSAVTDGLICFPIASKIIKLCLHLEAYDEGQHLVECILQEKPFPKPTSSDDVLFNKELSILDQFAIITGRFGFLYRKLTTLFENRLLPIEWISSPDMIERWSGVIQCISEGNSDAKDAEVLLRTVILMSGGLFSPSMASHVHRLRIRSRIVPSDNSEGWPQTDKQNGTSLYQRHMLCAMDGVTEETHKTGLRLLAALCALDFVQRLAEDPNAPSTPVLHDLALEAHQIIEIQVQHATSIEESKFHADGPCLVLLAAGLCSSMAKKDETALRWYLDVFGRKKLSNQFPTKAASFLSVVASWRGQALASDGFECIQETVQQLLRISSLGCCLPETRKLVGKIATTAAIQYALITSKPRHLSWALDIETRVNGITVGLTCQTPRRIPQHSLAKAHLGFKWEEGICEWVAGTPGVPKPKPVIFRDVNDIASDSEPMGTLKPASALDPSPSRLSGLREASSLPTRAKHELRKERVAPDSVTKTSCGTFVGVEINRPSQANIRAPQRDWPHKIVQTSQRSSAVGADELSDAESTQDRPICKLKKQTQATLQMNGLVQRGGKSGRKHGVMEKAKALAGSQGRNSVRVPVKHVTEAVDSEDELNHQ